MRNTNKKGFTIVELVIVVAVIAILAAVLIPTFSGIIRKANISSDTVVAKNLNTAAISAGAKDFDSAIAAVKDAGYLLANLNAKAADCYFVWEEESNQFLLYDLKDGKIIYSNTEVTNAPNANWCFAVSNSKVADSVESVLSNITIKKTVASVDDLKDAISAGGEFYIDESVVLDKNNLLTFDAAGKTTIVNLGSASLNTSGILQEDGAGIIPVEVKQGNVTFKGGTISTAGENLNYHGLKVSYALQTSSNTETTFNGTKFDLTNHESQIRIFGKAVMENVVIDAIKTGVETRYNGDLTLKNVTITSDGGSEWYGACVWSCNFNSKGEDGKEKEHIGTAKITIESGTYTSKECNGGFANVVACGGTVVINGGTFTSPAGEMFAIKENGRIEINGGSFNGVEFKNLTVEKLQEMTVTGTVSETANGFAIN